MTIMIIDSPRHVLACICFIHPPEGHIVVQYALVILASTARPRCGAICFGDTCLIVYTYIYIYIY